MIARITCFLFLALAALAQQPPQQTAQPAAKPAVPVAAFQISGTLVDSTNGQPLAHTRVAVAPVTDRNAITTVITGSDGRFVFHRLAVGKYTLTAQRRGYLTQSFNQHDQFSSSIAVGAGLDSRDLVFRLPPESAITGVITDEQGEPVRQGQVLLFQAGVSSGTEGVHFRNRALTDDEGAYRFGHLAPGKYLIAVSAKPWYAQAPIFQGSGEVAYRPEGGLLAGNARENETASPMDEKTAALNVAYPITFYPGAIDSASASLIPLAQGEKGVANINLQPVPALVFRVKTDEQMVRQRYASLEVKLFDTTVGMPAQSQPVSPGMMVLEGVAPGHYTMKVTDYANGSAQTVSTREIDVSASGDLEKLQAPAQPSVSVSLQFEAGAAASAQSAVRLYNKKTSEAFVERIEGKSEVEFKGGIPPGVYEISITNAQGLFLKSITSAEAVPIGRTVQIKGPGTVKLSLVVAQGQAQIHGVVLRVVSDDEKPVSGAMVLLVPADPAHNQVLLRRDQSDTDGTFTLADVVPGKYTLLALENGWDLEWANPAVLKPLLPQGEALVVQAGGKYEVKLKAQ